MTRVGFEPTTYGLKGLPNQYRAGEEYNGPEGNREELGVESSSSGWAREGSGRTAPRTACLSEDRAVLEAPIQERAVGFLTESRAAWAQTGNGPPGVHPVGRGFSSRRVRPNKTLFGGPEGAKPPRIHAAAEPRCFLLFSSSLDTKGTSRTQPSKTSERAARRRKFRGLVADELEGDWPERARALRECEVGGGTVGVSGLFSTPPSSLSVRLQNMPELRTACRSCRCKPDRSAGGHSRPYHGVSRLGGSWTGSEKDLAADNANNTRRPERRSSV